MNNGPLYYNNNPNLKAAGVPHNFTKEEVGEYIKCGSDPIYFIEKYTRIVAGDGIVLVPKLFEYQKKTIKAYLKERKIVNMQSRQSAKSTTAALFLTWFILFHSNTTSAILANKALVSKEILEKVKFAYEGLPKFLQQGVTTWNKASIELENGSRILAAATSSSAIRGFAITGVLLLDEFAFVEQGVADEFFTSVYPTLSASQKSKLIITSTPKGYNHFFKIWDEAEKGINGFVPLRVDWWEVPGRDEKWAKDQSATLGEVKYNQEVLCQFLGSSHTLISPNAIRNMSADIPIHIGDGLKIYKEPINRETNPNEIDHTYVIICDPSRGGGNNSSAIIVFDITIFPIRIVATYKSNTISPLLLPALLNKLGKTYNNASVLVEINDNGQQVADLLWSDFEYENMIIFDKSIGVRTDKRVKRIGCSNIKDMIESQKIIINDLDLISEFSGFIQIKQSFEADTGFNDDLVMCCVLLGWLTQTREYSHISNNDMRQEFIKANIQMIEDEVLPFGFIDNGTTDFGEEFSSETGWF